MSSSACCGGIYSYPLPVPSLTLEFTLTASASCLFSKLPCCSLYTIKSKPLCLVPVQPPFSHISGVLYDNLSCEVGYVSFIFQVRNWGLRGVKWLFLGIHLIGICPAIRASICLSSKFGSFSWNLSWVLKEKKGMQ